MADNKFNSEQALARCEPMSKLQAVIGGKWKILILWYVAHYRVQRFSQLKRRLTGVTQSTLTKQLRELEADGFLHREIYEGIVLRRSYQEIPPRVEYSLTEFGQSFVPVLEAMLSWSEKQLCPDFVNPYQSDN